MSYSLLIIDDEPMICMGTKAMINWASYGFTRIDMCFNYEDGLKAALAHNYTMILCDIRLHDQSGLNIVRQLRACGIDSCVVLISAYAEFSYAQTALELGVFQYLLKPYPREILDACVSRFVATIPVVSAQISEKQESPRQDRRRAARIERIQEYIHENYADSTLSLAKVANAFYLNASYLGQRFRQQTGIKFTDYLNQYRIIKACELLMKGQYLTYEISDMVGFGNLNYFHRVFKKITGVTTEEFRKKAPFGEVKMPVLP